MCRTAIFKFNSKHKNWKGLKSLKNLKKFKK